MARSDALLLDASLRVDDLYRAWLVWSGAAEAAVADAYRFGSGLVPARGLVLGRGSARWGGPEVRKGAVAMLLMPMILVMSFRIRTLLLHPYLT